MRSLVHVIGTSQETRLCQECSKRPSRIDLRTGRHRNGSLRAILRVCDVCALRLVGSITSMLAAISPRTP